MANNTETLTYLVRFATQDAAKVTKALKDFKDAAATTGVTVEGFTKQMGGMNHGALSLSENLARLAQRAILTIPIWLGLRAIFTSTTGTISDSVNSFIELDAALRNVENEIKGTANLSTFLKELSATAQQLSSDTGLAPGKIVEVFRQFATAGIDARTSLEGMKVAVTGSVATMGDSIETARFLADTYNTLGSQITEVNTPADKFNFIMGTVASLMPTNTFTLQEFTEAFKNFGGTAKAANLTLDETFLLIAASGTAMQRGARAGTQLKSAFEQLSRSSGEVQNFLGENISGLSQYEIFFRVVSKASRDINTGGIKSNTILKQLADLFGNRGSTDVKALAANMKHFVDESERLKNLDFGERLEAMMDRFRTATEKLEIQLNRLKTIRESLGRNFIAGLFDIENPDDPAKFFKKINDELEKTKILAEDTGAAIRAIVEALTFLAILRFGGGAASGVAKAATTAERTGRFAAIRAANKQAPKFDVPGWDKGAQAAGNAGVSPQVFSDIKNTSNTALINRGVTAIVLGKLAWDAAGALVTKGLGQISKLPLVGPLLVTPFGLAAAIGLTTKFMIDKIARDTIRMAEEFDTSDNARLEKFLIQNDINRVKNRLTPVRPDLSDDAVQKAKEAGELQLTSTLDLQGDTRKTILNFNQEILKSQGALNSQLLTQLEIDKKRLGIYDDENAKVKSILDKIKAITEERKLQSRLGDKSTKLFDIAQTFGIDTAKKIGEVLQDKSLFSTFARTGGAEFDIFKQFFPDLVKQQQMEAFFTGNIIPGFQDQQGGTRIPIDEQAIRNQVNNNISNVFNIQSLDVERIAHRIIDIVNRDMIKSGSTTQKALAEALGGKDNTTL